MNEASKQAILSAIRSILVVIGSLLTGKGFVDDATFQQLLGAVMVILPLVWGIWDKFSSEKKTQVREVSAVRAGVAAATDPNNLINKPSDVGNKQAAQDVIEEYAPTIPITAKDIK